MAKNNHTGVGLVAEPIEVKVKETESNVALLTDTDHSLPSGDQPKRKTDKVAHKASAYSVAQDQFDRAATAMGLEPYLREYLRVPQRELIVHFPAHMDNGELKMFTGFRVQHSTVKGPTKGGIRYHPGVTLDECRALAMWMTWKCSLMNLPYGGAKGGVIMDPRDHSKQ